MPADSLVIVLAGGVGERLYPLTKDRAKPAVPFGGPYRIIDFTPPTASTPASGASSSPRQYKSLSLNRHIRMGWSSSPTSSASSSRSCRPQQRVGEHWYQGTADAIYQNLYSISARTRGT